MIKVAIAGFRGKMGSSATNMVLEDARFQLVALLSHKKDITNLNQLSQYQGENVPVFSSKEELVETVKPDVWIDFTSPDIIFDTLSFLIEHDIHPVVGTTGLSKEELSDLQKRASDKQLGGLIAPNFSVGAILMMRFAKEAANYFPDVEIIELHHDQKLDAPSGTALRTAEEIATVRESKKQGHPDEVELLPGARGADVDGIKIHSVRLPGLIAHQQVQFGAKGEGLMLRHDSYDRSSFMAGVALGCVKVMNEQELIYGLEYLL